MAILLPSLQVFALPVLLDGGGGRREVSPANLRWAIPRVTGDVKYPYVVLLIYRSGFIQSGDQR